MSLDAFLKKIGDWIDIDLDLIVAAIDEAEKERRETIERTLDSLYGEENISLMPIVPITEHEDLLARRYSDVYQPICLGIDYELKFPKIRNINIREYEIGDKDFNLSDPIKKVPYVSPVYDYLNGVESDRRHSASSLLDDDFVQRLVEVGLLPSDGQPTEKYTQKRMDYTFGGKDKI